MTKNFIILLMIVFANIKIFAQSDNFEMWYKVSPEFSLSFKKIDFKFRPIDYTVTPDVKKARMDFMLGVKFWKFTLYNYTKFDDHHGFWTGPRLDLNFLLADKKLLLHFQERFFFGLNETSSNHYYLIQLFQWNFNEWFNAGILGYGKWNVDTKFNEGLWFFGPIVGFELPYNFDFQIACTKNIFDTNTYMSLFLLKYKLKL
jgi:hypothetical protein